MHWIKTQSFFGKKRTKLQATLFFLGSRFLMTKQDLSHRCCSLLSSLLDFVKILSRATHKTRTNTIIKPQNYTCFFLLLALEYTLIFLFLLFRLPRYSFGFRFYFSSTLFFFFSLLILLFLIWFTGSCSSFRRLKAEKVCRIN